MIEVKNYLDQGSVNSAVDILSQIKESANDNKTKYAIFSFNRIFVGNKATKEKLRVFQNIRNNFIITNETGNKDGFKIIDLSELFNIIKKDVIIR